MLPEMMYVVDADFDVMITSLSDFKRSRLTER